MSENFQVQDSFQQDQPMMPNNNMPLAIIGTIIGLCGPCCILGLVIGIVAIVNASNVKSKYSMGDYAGAESSAKNAKILSYIAIVLGIIGIIITIIQIQMHGGIDGYMDYIKSITGQY